MANTAADLIFYNARVITLEDNQPKAELVAIKDNKILDIGGNRARGKACRSKVPFLRDYFSSGYRLDK
jgi:predicted amidohydrolase YtcJ